MSGHDDEKSSTIRYYSISADIGYDLLKSERLMLYPLAGIGFQKYQAIFYKDYSTVLFDDVLESTEVQNSIKSVRFNNPFFVYRVGFGFSVTSPKSQPINKERIVEPHRFDTVLYFRGFQHIIEHYRRIIFVKDRLVFLKSKPGKRIEHCLVAF